MPTTTDLRFVPVPPPSKTPVQQAARALGLCDGLRVEATERRFRCANCNRMSGEHLVWVPDGVRVYDAADAVAEECRLNAYNGHGSGWCLRCARTLGHTGAHRGGVAADLADDLSAILMVAIFLFIAVAGVIIFAPGGSR